MAKGRIGGTAGTGRTGEHLERSASWAGVRAGEQVHVSGVRQRGATWTFLAHVRNVRTGEEWVEVVGGRPGARSVRSFPSEHIYPVSGAGPSPSLLDAPRLPL